MNSSKVLSFPSTFAGGVLAADLRLCTLVLLDEEQVPCVVGDESRRARFFGREAGTALAT